MRTIELRVLCEGPTESNFVVRVLAPHLRGQFRVHARPENLGGVKRFEKLRNAIKAEVGRSRAHQFVTTMIDLYALPDYPGDPQAEGVRGASRAARIEATMSRDLPSGQFIPYIQVLEFEALMFVDLEQLVPAFPEGEAAGAVKSLRSSQGDLAPEDIDDGPTTAPSKRLIRVIPAYKKLKPIIGPTIAAAVGLARLREACPHFHQWISRLEGLADPT